MLKNRSKLARERAGLSLGQAARLLGIALDRIIAWEESDLAFFEDAPQELLCEVYGVNPEWLTGERERYDYKAMKGVQGWDEISGHDRDVVAEFAASMTRTPSKTLEQIIADRDAKEKTDGK